MSRELLTNHRRSNNLPSIEPYLDSPCALEKAHDRYGGSQGLLHCAAQSVADAGSGDDGAGSRESSDDEVRALRQFVSEAGLWMHASAGNALLEADPMRGGKDHRVIRDASGWLHPIDAHFHFNNRAARVAAVEKLGLDRLPGQTALAASGLPRSKG